MDDRLQHTIAEHSMSAGTYVMGDDLPNRRKAIGALAIPAVAFLTSAVSTQRPEIDLVRGWLPPDIESFWVNQVPFTIRAAESIEQLYGRPTQAYAIVRLKLLNDGEFCRRLDGRKIRLVVAGGRNLRRGSDRVPTAIPDADVVYFYFFSSPLNPSSFPRADEILQARPVWRMVAKVYADGPSKPHNERPTRAAESWLTAIGKDLLVLAGKRETLEQTLQRMSNSSGLPALPESLPEWAQVNRRASFWGLRHYSESAKDRDLNYPLHPSADALGLTVAFEASDQRIEIRYLSPTPPLVTSEEAPPNLVSDFKVDQPQSGVWRFVSNLKERGDFPAHLAFVLMGFG